MTPTDSRELFYLTDDQRMIRDLARRVAREKIAPLAAHYDETEAYPEKSIQAIVDAGLFGLWVPEAYGGSDLGCLALALACEEIAWACAATATQYLDQPLGGLPILLFGTEEQKKKYLPRLATGEWFAAYSLSEPGAGSDAAGLRTTAVRRGDTYVLNGSKQWCTNGDHADVICVFATVDPGKRARGVTAFLVERGTPGFTVGKKEKKMGIRASTTREMILEDCRIPKDRLISKEGMGFIITMKTLDNARPGAGALAVGLAQEALDEAAVFAKERHQFGSPIIHFQAVQHLLADMATKVEAARALIYAVARYIDTKPKDYTKVAAMSKLFPTDMAMQVTVDAVQVMGGHGYMREYPVEKMMRDAKILQIYEGTNQIMRNIIGLALNKEYSKKK